MRSILPIIGIALALLLLHGCVVETDVSPGTSERVLSAGAQDFDQDSVTDFKNYVFSPVSVTAESGANITFQKTATAGETQSALAINGTNALSQDDISSLETLIFEFDSDRLGKERECLETLGLGGAGGQCASPDECAARCTSAQCKKYSYVSELLGYWIYRFSQDQQAMDNDVSDIRDDIVSIGAASSADKEIMMRKISSVLDRTILMNTNPLLNDNMFGACRPLNYDNEKLLRMLSILGNYERKPEGYTYAVNLKITVKSRDYSEVRISDTLPRPMLSGLTRIEVPQEGAVYYAKANNITWPAVKSGIYTEYIVGYTFQGTQGIREDIFENWPTPRASMKIVSFTNNPVVKGVIEISKQIYSSTRWLGYYTALALIAFFWDACIMLAILAIKTIVASLSTAISRSSFRDNMVVMFGKANMYWKEYAVFALLFLAIGYGLMLFSAKVPEDVLNIDNIVRHLAESVPGALSMVFIFLALHLVYSLAEDRIKGALVGRAYYENLLDLSPKANALRLRKLKEKLAELEQGIKDAGSVDVGEEKSVLVSAPVERIEAMMKKPSNGRAVKELIDMYIYKIEAAIIHIEEKKKIFGEYWGAWSSEIADRLSESDNVPFSALKGIPTEWRVKAVSRYVAENQEDGLIVEGQSIRRLEERPGKMEDEALKKVITKDLAIGGVLFRNDAVAAARSSAGNKTLEAILSWKVANYAKTLGQKVLNLDYLGITITGEKDAVAFTKVQEKEGAVFAKKENLAAALEEFGKRLKRT